MSEWEKIQELVTALCDARHLGATHAQLEPLEDGILEEGILKAIEQPLRKKAQFLLSRGRLPRDSDTVDIYVSYCRIAVCNLLADKNYNPRWARIDTRLQKVFEREIPRKVWEELVDANVIPIEVLRSEDEEEDPWERIDSKEFTPIHEDKTIWPWHFEPKTVDSKRLPHVRWEIRLDDIAVINRTFSGRLLRMWKRELSKNHCETLAEYREKLKAIMDSGDRILLKRLVFAKGARGQLDVSALEELNGTVFGSEVYDRRALWKKLSSF